MLELAGTRVIDIHAHLGASWIGQTDFTDFTPADLVAGYDRFGVEKACVSSWQILYEPKQGNVEICQAVQQFPDRLMGFCVVSPRQPGALEEVENCTTKQGMKGIKLHPSQGKWKADSRLVDPIIDFAQSKRIPVLMHTWSDDHSHPTRVGNLAKRFPRATIIMAHMSADAWLEAIEVAADHDALLLDTAVHYNQYQVLKTAVEKLGSERILFGSDFPEMNLGAELAKIVYAQISDRDKKRILGENAAELLGISK